MEDTATPPEAPVPAKPEAPSDPVQTDYFGFEESYKVMLDDGVSYVEHTALNEGGRRKYLNAVNRDVRLNRQTGDMTVRMAAGDDRIILLEHAISGWNLQRGGKPVPFNPGTLGEFLEKANPTVIDPIEKDVRDKNPWLLSDVTVEDVDEQIERLKEQREKIAKREEGKDS